MISPVIAGKRPDALSDHVVMMVEIGWDQIC